jgi:hypothetical protein
VLAEQLRLINRQLAAAERQLDRLCKELAEPVADDENSKAAGQRVEQDDVTILSSLPGVGRIILATLLAEASDALQRRDYRALRNLCGAAPVTRQSGKSRMVLRWRACNRRLSNALFNWARVAIQHDATSRARYAALSAEVTAPSAQLAIVCSTSPVPCLKLALCSILRSRAQKALAKGWGVQQRTNTRGFSALALSCRRFRWLERKGKLRTVVATAVARELLAFIWAINREVMGTRQA